MGNSESFENARDQLISKFDSQRLLLIGRFGAGKTSLINSFNHVINLVDENLSAFSEIAPIGAGEAGTKTKLYTLYGKERRMYQSLSESKLLVLQNYSEKAPVFIDLPGIPPKADEIPKMKDLIKNLLLGKIQEGYDLNPWLQSVASNKNPPELPLLTDETPVSAVIVVIQASSNYKKAAEDFKFLTILKEAVESHSENKERKIFAIFTKSAEDEVWKRSWASKVREQKEQLRLSACNALNCTPGNVFFLENYIPKEYEKGIPPKYSQKEMQIIEAFSSILDSWNKPIAYSS